MTTAVDSAKHRRWAYLAAVLLPTLFVLWPLSLGPVAWLEHHGLIGEDVWIVADVVYSPWIWLAQHWEPAGRFFIWYLAHWVPLS